MPRAIKNPLFSMAGMGIRILLVLLLGVTAMHQLSLIDRLGFDGENSPTESESLYALSRLRAGEKLYLDYNVAPHVVTAYMPLFYGSTELIARPAKDWLEMVLMARCSVYLYWLGIGVVIFGLARQVGCGRPAALLSSLLWGASQLGSEWANSVRPDAAALFFSLVALWIYQRKHTPSHVGMSLVFLVVAFFYKHTVFAPLVAILVEEILDRRYRRAAVIASVWVALIAAVVIVAQVMTKGLFMLNVFTGLNLTVSWSWTWVLIWTSLVMGWIAFSGATLVCCNAKWQAPLRLLKTYFLFSLVLAVARSRIFGAWSNHYLEPLAAACVLTGLLAGDSFANSTRGLACWAHRCWLAMALGISLGLVVNEARNLFQDRRTSERSQWQRFVTRIDGIGGPILAEDGYITVRSGRKPFMIDANKFSHMQRRGKFDDEELVHKIQSGGFAAIITKFPIDAPAQPGRTLARRWLESMPLRYHLAETYPLPSRGVTFYLYRPEARPRR